MQLFDYRQQPALAAQPGFGGGVLPFQQKADERRRGYRLNLAAQGIDSSAVNAGQDPAVAKFLGFYAGPVAAAQHYPLLLQLRQGIGDIVQRQGQGCRQFAGGEGADAVDPAAG